MNPGSQLHPLKLGNIWGRDIIDVDRPSTLVPPAKAGCVMDELDMRWAIVAGMGGDVISMRDRTLPPLPLPEAQDCITGAWGKETLV